MEARNIPLGSKRIAEQLWVSFLPYGGTSGSGIGNMIYSHQSLPVGKLHFDLLKYGV